MDDLLDRLRLLKYQRDFCKPMNFRPLTRTYFSVPAPNPNEQFYYFTSLFSWLLKVKGQHFEPPGQFDDPNATIATMMAEVKKLNIPFDYPPTKLRQAFGEPVLHLLQSLAEKALLATGFVFKKPVHKIEEFAEEAEVDADAEVTTEAVDEALASEDEDEEVFVDSSFFAKKPDQVKPETTTKPKIDPSEWRLEVERVTPMLKVQISNDNKDWRIHFDQMKHHNQTIGLSLSETQEKLSKLHVDIEKTLEKISSREKYINTQFETQTEEYRALQDQLSELKQKYNVVSTTVTELTNELSRISEELDGVKSRMDDIGSGMTDSKPLTNIKQGVSRLKGEIKQMDLRIGVIEHTLLHARLKNKGPVVERPFSDMQIFTIPAMVL